MKTETKQPNTNMRIRKAFYAILWSILPAIISAYAIYHFNQTIIEGQQLTIDTLTKDLERDSTEAVIYQDFMAGLEKAHEVLKHKKDTIQQILEDYQMENLSDKGATLRPLAHVFDGQLNALHTLIARSGFKPVYGEVLALLEQHNEKLDQYLRLKKNLIDSRRQPNSDGDDGAIQATAMQYQLLLLENKLDNKNEKLAEIGRENRANGSQLELAKEMNAELRERLRRTKELLADEQAEKIRELEEAKKNLTNILKYCSKKKDLERYLQGEIDRLEKLLDKLHENGSNAMTAESP